MVRDGDEHTSCSRVPEWAMATSGGTAQHAEPAGVHTAGSERTVLSTNGAMQGGWAFNPRHTADEGV